MLALRRGCEWRPALPLDAGGGRSVVVGLVKFILTVVLPGDVEGMGLTAIAQIDAAFDGDCIGGDAFLL